MEKSYPANVCIFLIDFLYKRLHFFLGTTCCIISFLQIIMAVWIRFLVFVHLTTTTFPHHSKRETRNHLIFAIDNYTDKKNLQDL